MPDVVTQPDLVVELDVPRRLRFDVNAFADVEDRSGRALGALLASAKTGGGAAVRWLLWCCLLHETPTITPHEVGRLLQAHWVEKGKRWADLGEPIAEAIHRSRIFTPIAKSDDTKKKEPDPAASSASATG